MRRVAEEPSEFCSVCRGTGWDEETEPGKSDYCACPEGRRQRAETRALGEKLRQPE